MINLINKTLIKSAFFLFILLVSIFTQAQVNLDSLWGVWNDETKPDSSRTLAMHKISWNGYLYSNPDSAFYFAQILYDFAEKKGVKKEMARALNTQGVSYYIKGDYVTAMHYYQLSLEITEEISDEKRMASILNNMGLIYSRKGSYNKALDHYQRTLKIYEDIDDKSRMAGVLNNIGVICIDQGEYSKALEYFQRCLKIAEEIQDKRRKAVALNNMGIIYEDQGKFNEALESYQRSLEFAEEVDNKIGIANILNHIGVLYMNQGDFNIAMGFYQRSLKIREELSDERGMANTMLNIGKIHNKEGKYVQAASLCKNALQKAEEINGLVERSAACLCLYEAYKALGDDKKALEYHERIKMLDDSVKAEETSEKLQQMEFERKMLADSLVQEEEKLKVQISHEAEVRKKNRVRNIFILSALILLIGAIGIHRRMVIVRKAKKAVENEKALSDKLLLNILPTEIAEELKRKGRAEARKFEMVTILFTDFKEFTQISEKLSAEELVGEINTCFKRFDTICTKYGIEKIKTIGDSYMAAGGLPVPTDDSVKRTVLAGLEMAEFMINRKQEREAKGDISFEMRVGIHTGPVVAGIVGVTKFQYDIWGDTVNTASRIENSGEVGMVNISRSTYELIKEDPIFKFHSRGKVKVKGKGDIEMWFVEKVL